MKTLNYTTRQGDSLFRVANLFYLKWDLWPLIYYYNSALIGDSPLSLETGLSLLIPVPPVEDSRYTADDEDSSMSIAFQFYGVREFYYLIDAANEFKKITSGDEILIPALCTQLELDAASDIRRGLNVL